MGHGQDEQTVVQISLAAQLASARVRLQCASLDCEAFHVEVGAAAQ
jgi:hypothetical protein